MVEESFLSWVLACYARRTISTRHNGILVEGEECSLSDRVVEVVGSTMLSCARGVVLCGVELDLVRGNVPQRSRSSFGEIGSNSWCSGLFRVSSSGGEGVKVRQRQRRQG